MRVRYIIGDAEGSSCANHLPRIENINTAQSIDFVSKVVSENKLFEQSIPQKKLLS